MVPTMLLLMMPTGTPAKASFFSSNVRIVPVDMTGGGAHWHEINGRDAAFAAQLEELRKQQEESQKRQTAMVGMFESMLDETNKEIQCQTKLNSPNSTAELKKLEEKKQRYERLLGILKKR